MANPTTNYGFVMPTPTDLVTDLPADFEVFGQGVDTQMLTNANAATQKATLTTTGDIYYASGAGTPARLGIGSSGQVLQVSAGLPAWGAALAGGMTLISTTTLSGASISLSSIPSSYNSLTLVIRDFLPATDGASVRMQFNTDTGTNYQTTVVTATAMGGNAQTFASTNLTITSRNDNAVANGLFTVQIPDYANAVTWKFANSAGLTVDNAAPTSFRTLISNHAWNQTSAITSIELFPDSGNFTSGSVLLYGVK